MLLRGLDWRGHLIKSKRMKTETEFWNRVGYPDEKGCQKWTGTIYAHGYGVVYYNGKNWRVHRLAWFLTFGAIPDGRFVCHRCNVKACCNTDHLYLATPGENSRDAVRDGLTATGDRHWTHVKPWNRPVGERNGSRKHPERLARGERHGSRTHPDRLKRGETHPSAKITDNQAREIPNLYLSGLTQAQIAERYGVNRSTISKHLLGRIRKFTRLIASQDVEKEVG